MARTRSLVTAALLAALLMVSKFALDGLPNIELISLLLILYTLEFPRLCLPVLYTYVVLYGLLNGFGIWWVAQLYIWLPLVLAAHLLRGCTQPLVFALTSGVFGLAYGALYALSYGLMNGPGGAVAWWISGIPFDLLHGGGNFVVALLLFTPLRTGLRKAKQRGAGT